MENSFVKNKLEQVKREGYGLHLEGVLSNAFDIHKKSILPGLLATFLYLVVMMVVGLSMFGTLYGMSLTEFVEMIQRNPNALESAMGSISWTSILIYSAVSGIAGGMVAPLLSGIYKVSYNTQYGVNGSVADLFAYYRQPYFLNIFLYTFLFSFVLQVLNFGLDQSIPIFGALIAFVIQIILSVTLILTIPFIVFANFSWMEAMKASMAVTSKNWFFLFFILLISVIISFVGIIFCGIGVLFTFPFLYIATFVLYDKIIGFNNQVDVISQIGEE